MDGKYLESFKSSNIYKIGSFWEYNQENICVICNQKKKEKTQNDACRHSFCYACILNLVRVKNICPICKRTIMKLYNLE